MFPWRVSHVVYHIYFVIFVVIFEYQFTVHTKLHNIEYNILCMCLLRQYSNDAVICVLSSSFVLPSTFFCNQPESTLYSEMEGKSRPVLEV